MDNIDIFPPEILAVDLSPNTGFCSYKTGIDIVQSMMEISYSAKSAPLSLLTTELNTWKPKGIILIGDHRFRRPEVMPLPDQLFRLDIPILGIGEGAHMIAERSQGHVSNSLALRMKAQRSRIFLIRNDPLFDGLDHLLDVHLLSESQTERPPRGAQPIAATSRGHCAAYSDRSRKIWGIDFYPSHPETVCGSALLANFARICGCVPREGMAVMVRTNDIGASRYFGEPVG